MSNTHPTISAKQEAASDAARVHNAKAARSRRLSAKNRSLQQQVPRNRSGPVHTAPVSDEEEDDLPKIHPALGRWPENSVPNIYWDLANPERWNYKRPFSEEELEGSPFEPKQRSMTILLRPDMGCVIPIKPLQGYRFITLRCFQQAIITGMQYDVSRERWLSATTWQKYDIAMAFYRRTGNLPVIPNLDVFAEWKKYLTVHANDPEATECIVNQMTEYVTRGAAKKMTRLQSVDLLGYRQMFAGLTYVKESYFWVMDTTCRHIAGMAHHLLPRPNMAPNGVQGVAPNVVPNAVPVAPIMPPAMGINVAPPLAPAVAPIPKQDVVPAMPLLAAVVVAQDVIPPMIHAPNDVAALPRGVIPVMPPGAAPAIFPGEMLAAIPSEAPRDTRDMYLLQAYLHTVGTHLNHGNPYVN